MKKTTYWVIGMFIVCFLFTIGIMINAKYNINEMKAQPMALASMQTDNIRVIKTVFDSKESKKLVEDGKMDFWFNLVVSTGKEVGKVTYPKSFMKLSQQGDTLIITVTHKSVKPGQLRDKSPIVTICTGQSLPSLNILANQFLNRVELKKQNIGSVVVKGGDPSSVSLQNCELGTVDIKSGNNLELNHSKIQTLIVQVDKTDLAFDDKGYHIGNLYLRGSNEDYQAIDINSKNVDRAFLQPVKGKKIAATFDAETELNFRK
jgi:hypothetical protein